MSRRVTRPIRLPELLIERPDQFASILEKLEKHSVLGLDTEFVGEDTYRPELCLIQVATPDELIVIDPLRCGPITEFWELLASPDRQVVVHAGREEVRSCWHAIGRVPTQVFDLQIAAGFVGITFPIGYSNLVHDVLSAKAHKFETLTDWRKRPLSPAQIKYAYDDVRYLLPIQEALSRKLQKLGRTQWVVEECQSYAQDWITDEPAVEKWRRLKGLGGLNRKELAVIRALYVWRDETALRLDRPARAILRDDLILELARRTPVRIDSLRSLRGLSRMDVDAVFEVLSQALSLAPNQWPQPAEREIDPPHLTTLAGLLNVVLGELCTQKKLAASLVASMQDLKELLRNRLGFGKPGLVPHLDRGWRSESVTPILDDVLKGRSLLRVTHPKQGMCLELIPQEGPGTKKE